jgi:hypothetical protein
VGIVICLAILGCYLHSWKQEKKAEKQRQANLLPRPDRCAEALALKTLFTDASAFAMCETTLGGRWNSVLDNWRTRWESSEDDPLGAAILQVYDDLENSNYLPSCISERLGAGNASACFSLATLLSNMKAPSDPKSEAPANLLLPGETV